MSIIKRRQSLSRVGFMGLCLLGMMWVMPTTVQAVTTAYEDVSIQESVLVQQPNEVAFSYLSDIKNVNTIMDNIVNVHLETQPNLKPEGLLQRGTQYTRTMLVHGVANAQTVTIVDDAPNEQFTTSTELYGFEVRYQYRFSAITAQSTRITLTKTARIDGFWNILRPLLRHLLTAPEHDGLHLLRLQSAVEAHRTLPS